MSSIDRDKAASAMLAALEAQDALMRMSPANPAYTALSRKVIELRYSAIDAAKAAGIEATS